MMKSKESLNIIFLGEGAIAFKIFLKEALRIKKKANSGLDIISLSELMNITIVTLKNNKTNQVKKQTG